MPEQLISAQSVHSMAVALLLLIIAAPIVCVGSALVHCFVMQN